MNTNITPQAGSVIKVEESPEGLSIFWNKSTLEIRMFVTLILTAFTALWYSSIWSDGNPQGHSSLAYFGVVFAVITILLLLLASILRPEQPEKITLARDYLDYDSGDGRSDSYLLGPRFAGQKEHLEEMFSKRRLVRIHKTEWEGPRLVKVGFRHKLEFPVSESSPLIVGATLSEPERTWLFEIVNDWHREALQVALPQQ